MAGGDWSQLFGPWHFTNDPDFTRDLATLLSIADEPFDRALTAVEAEKSLLTRKHLTEILERELGNAPQERAIRNFLSNLLPRSQRAEPASFAATLIDQVKTGHKSVTEGQLSILRKRIERLVTPKIGFQKQLKAEILARRTGLKLNGFNLVSDLRPILDDSAESVEGLFPVTTLKLVYEGPGLPQALEVNLTEKQLVHIRDQAQRAITKLATLKKFATASKVALPDGISTVEDEDDDE